LLKKVTEIDCVLVPGTQQFTQALIQLNKHLNCADTRNSSPSGNGGPSELWWRTYS